MVGPTPTWFWWGLPASELRPLRRRWLGLSSSPVVHTDVSNGERGTSRAERPGQWVGTGGRVGTSQGVGSQDPGTSVPDPFRS